MKGEIVICGNVVMVTSNTTDEKPGTREAMRRCLERPFSDDILPREVKELHLFRESGNGGKRHNIGWIRQGNFQSNIRP